MDTEYIIIREYCERCRLDPDFIIMLEDEGLIEVHLAAGERYIPVSQLGNLERYARMYYDLAISIPGIDAIQNLLGQVRELKREIRKLQEHLRIYVQDDEEEVHRK